jgi:hypothetical protein
MLDADLGRYAVDALTTQCGYPAVALSRQRCSEPERDGGPVVRCARAAAAVVAVLAVRTAMSSAHATSLHIAAPWILILAALGAGVMLREAGRGLAVRLPRVQWSPRFAGRWAASSMLLLTVLLSSGSSLESGTWISIALAVCLGLVLAASLPGARRLLKAVMRLRGRIPVGIRGYAVSIPCALTLTAPVRAPLLAGWSDRGPPPHLS